MTIGILVKFDGSHHAVVVSLVLKSHPGLPNPTGATFEVVLSWCQGCSSKPYWSFGAVEHRSLRQRRLRKNHNSGTATMVEKDPEQRRCRAKD